MNVKNKKNKQNLNKINEISSPIINTRDINAETVPIKLFGTKDLSDSRRASTSSDTSISSSFKLYPGDDAASLKSKRSTSSDNSRESLSEASDLYSSNESLYSVEDLDLVEDKESHDFVFEGDIGDTLSSLSSNNANYNPRSLSSFTTFSDTELTSIEGDKSKRRGSVDSGIPSSSEVYSSNESLSSAEDLGFAEDEESRSFVFKNDKKVENTGFATIKKPSALGKPIKVVPPTVPTFKSQSSDVNDSNLTSVVDESLGNILSLRKPMGAGVNLAKKTFSNPEDRFTSLKDPMSSQEKVKEINRKDQLSSEIDKFIPQVSVSTRKTVKERVEYGTLDMLRINAKRLNLKINKVDSLLKSGSLIKVDKNNNDKVLLITEKDTFLLKELKHDWNKRLKEVNKQLSKETKKVLVYEQSKQQELQDKVLENDVEKIKGVISTAKSKINFEERSSLLSKLESDLKVAYSHLGKNLHPDLKKAITELRRERWASQTNMQAIKPNDTTKNYLPESRVKLTFEEQKDIFSRKRDVAKNLLDSEQARGEDKKPKKKSNLEHAFNREFGRTDKKSCRTKLSEVSLNQITPALSR